MSALRERAVVLVVFAHESAFAVLAPLLRHRASQRNEELRVGGAALLTLGLQEVDRRGVGNRRRRTPVGKAEVVVQPHQVGRDFADRIAEVL